MGSNDLNTVSLIGRLVRDPDLRYTPNGSAVTSFDIANNRSFYNKLRQVNEERVSYFRIVVWNKMAEICNQYLKKGSRIAVSGRLEQERWSDKQTGQTRSSIKILANRVQFLDPAGTVRKEQSQPVGGQYTTEQPVQNLNDYPVSEEPFSDTGFQDDGFGDDEIPF